MSLNFSGENSMLDVSHLLLNKEKKRNVYDSKYIYICLLFFLLRFVQHSRQADGVNNETKQKKKHN
jgi:hypothetical protein